MSKPKCQCRFCQIDYPKHKAMLVETDIEKVREYAKEMFENWQMEQADSDWALAKARGDV